MLMALGQVDYSSYPKTTEGFKACDAECARLYGTPEGEQKWISCRQQCMAATGETERSGAMKAELEAYCAANPAACVATFDDFTRESPSYANWLYLAGAVALALLLFGGGSK